MTNLKVAHNGLLIPPQYLEDLGPEPCVRRIKGGLIVESSRLWRASGCAIWSHARVAAGSDTPGDDEIATLVDEVQRAIVDTNVFVSGLINPGAPGTIVDAVIDGRITPVFSAETLAELGDVRPQLQRFCALRSSLGRCSIGLPTLRRCSRLAWPISPFAT